MLNVSQEIFNQIAQTEEMQTSLMKEVFLAPQEKVAEIEEEIMDQIEEVVKKLGYSMMPSWKIALMIWEVLPLLIENKAITRYILKTNSLSLRMALPEILDPIEAVLLIQKDRPNITEEEMKALRHVIQSLEVH